MHRLVLSCLILAAAPAAPAFAIEANLQPEVVVSASRVVRTLDTTLADVDVITRDDIDASATRDISDLLRLQAGIDIARTGGPGGQTSIFMRGTNNNHVLVLIDGVRVAALGTGVFTWETLPLDTIERIEIVRGPRASYWGSDAIGGVIQIFTRRLDGPRVSLGVGSHEDFGLNAGTGHRGERGGFSVQFGTRDYAGFPSQNENGFAYEDKDHGLENRHLGVRGDVRLGTQTMAANLVRSEGTAEFAGGESDFTQQALALSLEGALGDRWRHRLVAGNAREDYATAAFFQRFESRRDTLGWQHEFDVGRSHKLIAGIDHVHERGENRDTFAATPIYRESRDIFGVYAGWQAQSGALDGEIALRRDDNSTFGGAGTGSAAFGWRFSDAVRAWLSHGEGFRAPTLNEQYSPGFGGMFAGNPELDPERSHSSEIGITIEPRPGQRLAANVHSTRVRDLISFSGEAFQAENVARARITGAELGYDGESGPWRLSATYTWQDPRNEDDDSVLLRRPKQKSTALLERRFGDAFRFGAELVQAGRREDVGGQTLAGYTLLNLRGSWQPASAWRFVARIENVTDRDYQLAYGYNTPGRTGYLELIWSAR